jgi:hypothetical protein
MIFTNFNYLNHNFIELGKADYYKCSKCNVQIAFRLKKDESDYAVMIIGASKFKFITSILEELKLTCDEIIIKEIIE